AVIDAEKQGRIFLRGRAVEKLVVEQRKHGRGRQFEARAGGEHEAGSGGGADGRFAKHGDAFHAVGAHGGVNGGHEQCRGNAYTADVADGEDELVRDQREEVVIVAADGARGAAESVHFKRLELRNLLGEKLCLHFLSDGQLVFEALLLLLLFDQL